MATFSLGTDDNPGQEMPCTLFPRITGHLKDFVESYRKHVTKINESLSIDIEREPIIPLIGTVKLHGTHADLVVHSNNEIHIQSRNREQLTAESDNYDTYKALSLLRSEILGLRDHYHARFRELNPGIPILDAYPLIIAGEWVGPSIQRGVALDKFKRRVFVILSASINSEWLPDRLYQDIHDEEHGIYNICRSGFYHDYVDVNDLEATRKRLMKPTLSVEKECPFAKAFGITGPGEGIVWKPANHLHSNPKLWIKTKGPQFLVNHYTKIPKDTLDAATRREKCNLFVEATVTGNRLMQGWKFLEEMGVEKDKKEGLRVFMEWAGKDVEDEEGGLLREFGLEMGDVRKFVGGVAARWYLSTLKNGGEI